MTQFYFWFENKVHDSWILEKVEDSHLVTCLQKCRYDTNCSALALGPILEKEDDFVRSCYTLSEINESDCEENDSCERKGFQVFHLSKPRKETTTENPTTTTTEISTDTSSKTTAASSSTVGISTTTKNTYSTTQASSTSEPSTSTTEFSTTTASPSTTTESLISTTDGSTTDSESTSTTANDMTTSKTSTTTSKSPSSSIDSSSTTEETSSTISESITTSTVATSTVTEVGTPSTAASETTTDASDCSNSDSPDCQIDNRRNSKCSGTEASIICNEPRDQLQVFGLVASAPLFSDAKMQVRCRDEFSQSLFKMKTQKDTYNPFDGTMGCKPDYTITGIDVCFQGELKYVSVECNPLQDGFTIEDKTDMAGNSKQDPAQALCPEKKSMISLKLNKDSNGEINVRIGCSKVVKK
ncbi:location of vulva defective 1-like [Argiope bruennichi]|uniref:location of vulva defective 1-like n=1 Tax=Argiope bruennichi TaxID=94029 RepID=UPI002494D028|nr:location of vulva defective 1-like [Argiope bruennichi]